MRPSLGNLWLAAWLTLSMPLVARAATPAPVDAAAKALAAGDVVLLDFAASWCGPCRSMAPLIGEISAAGWPVRHVDVDGEADLVKRFGITGVPCYILLVKGHEVGRIDGATTREELEKLLQKSRSALGIPEVSAPAPVSASATPQLAAVPGMPLPAHRPPAPLALEAAAPTQAAAPARVLPTRSPDPLPTAAAVVSAVPARPAAVDTRGTLPPGDRAALEQRLLAATARLRVDDGQGVSWGTGTVIDCRQGEALILTCGHIFRDSQGQGRVEVDLFGPGAPRGLAGQVISWDLKRDLALVSIFTDATVEPVKVGGAQRITAAGESVVTVGCNGGQDPTIHHSRVTAVDKYLGPANVQVAGQPVQGRSGGGLFGVDGTLLGVCNAADPEDNEGLFAALPAIHEQLDEAGLAFVYKSVYPSGAVADAGGPSVPSMPTEMPPVSFDRRDRGGALPTASTGPNAAPVTSAPPATAAEATQLSGGERALLDHVRQHEGRAEVICIVRPHGAPQAASEVFVLEGSSHEFVEQLSKTHAGHAQHGHQPASGRSDLAALPPADPLR
ncbi:MAG: trypsin-like peptidase domain-containing protein [Planctomycetia bacterium]